jgi:hypothetical protein
VIVKRRALSFVKRPPAKKPPTPLSLWQGVCCFGQDCGNQFSLTRVNQLQVGDLERFEKTVPAAKNKKCDRRFVFFFKFE